MSKKWYQENYFNRRNWLLENMDKRDLTSDEALILLLIDYHNEFSKGINLEVLAKSAHMSMEQLDTVMTSLCNKNYLVITSKTRITFNIDNVFEEPKKELTSSENLFEVFEEQFARPLTQREAMTLSEWVNIYDSQTIMLALREAVLKKRINFSYIDKILASSDKNETA
ncbi:MAG: DnaD domain protein [Erysipelotrichaceae bacterium]|nr:DnaD domain protein [Erysipelotrichaceae bacterium]